MRLVESFLNIQGPSGEINKLKISDTFRDFELINNDGDSIEYYFFSDTVETGRIKSVSSSYPSLLFALKFEDFDEKIIGVEKIKDGDLLMGSKISW